MEAQPADAQTITDTLTTMLTITRKLEFDAGHRIPDHKSQCRNLHGHRYTLEITLVGAIIEEEGNSVNGMIMDFSDVKALAKQHLVDVWDHAGRGGGGGGGGRGGRGS